MVDNEDVPLLLKRLCQSFVPSDLKNYITQSQRQKREEKFTNQFRLKALDCILFDYDEEYTQDNFEYLLQDARHKAVCGRYGMDESKKLHNALDHYLGESFTIVFDRCRQCSIHNFYLLINF